MQFLLRSSSKGGKHSAVAAFRAVQGIVVREGVGETREDAIAKAIGRRRCFYESLSVERDLLVAEVRGHDILLTAEGEFLHSVGGA
ncbi:MAG TPA: hypothetical protein PLN91_00555 [Rhodanobacteraceae bacterium]|nr:hypothetical protein [Rhodanobacteraceae bacterium]